jgi:AcrR family transcriptional regulator
MTKRRNAGAPDARDARDTILGATVALLREKRAGDVTTEEIARRAGCAKGLVHYHFKRKKELLAGAATQLWTGRAKAWADAMAKDDPQASIRAGWLLIEGEASEGTAAACAAIGLVNDELVVQSVNDARRAFIMALTDATTVVLRHMGLVPSVPPTELGTLLAATIEGISLQLGSGATPAELEQAWAAFWVGLLALTRRARA